MLSLREACLIDLAALGRRIVADDPAAGKDPRRLAGQLGEAVALLLEADRPKSDRKAGRALFPVTVATHPEAVGDEAALDVFRAACTDLMLVGLDKRLARAGTGRPAAAC